MNKTRSHWWPSRDGSEHPDAAEVVGLGGQWGSEGPCVRTSLAAARGFGGGLRWGCRAAPQAGGLHAFLSEKAPHCAHTRQTQDEELPGELWTQRENAKPCSGLLDRNPEPSPSRWHRWLDEISP